jgi:hypothetical protein
MAKARDTQTDEQAELDQPDDRRTERRADKAADVDQHDAGNVNGGPIDSPLVNSEVVGVDYVAPGDETTPATGAAAGTPGTWTPAGADPPADVAALQASSITASPATPWTTGQYVQTATAGAAGQACWTGSGWVGGAAP